MYKGIASFVAGTLLVFSIALRADDIEHQKKEAREA